MILCQKLWILLNFLVLTRLGKSEEIEISKQESTNSGQQNLCQTHLNGVMLANPLDCHKFYICINKKAYEYNCDPEYHYDSATKTCIKGSVCAESTADERPAVCLENSIRPIQSDCNMFEACIQGQYQKLQCPANYYFDAQHSMCVPFKFDAQFKCNCLMPEHTVLENTNNCETYFVCRSKVAFLENCPRGQYYNQKLNSCVTDLEGVCLMKPTVKPEDEKEKLNIENLKFKENDSIENMCYNLGLQGIHFETFPKNCDTFSICIKGQLYDQKCPQGFYYESERRFCLIDNENKCKSKENLTIKEDETQQNPKQLNYETFEQSKLFSKFIKL